jgi:hypothetical protein
MKTQPSKKKYEWDEKAYETYKEKPFASIAKIGKEKWFWVYWRNHHVYMGDILPDGHRTETEDPIHGVTDTLEEAIKNCGGRKNFTDECGRFGIHAYEARESIYALLNVSISTVLAQV